MNKEKNISFDKFYTSDEIRKIFRIKKQTLYNWNQSDPPKLPLVKFMSKCLYPKDQIDSIINSLIK